MSIKHEWLENDTWASEQLKTHPLKARMLKALGHIGNVFSSPDQETDVTRIDDNGLGVNVSDEKNQKFWYINIAFGRQELWIVENTHISGLKPSQDILKTSIDFDPNLFNINEE